MSVWNSIVGQAQVVEQLKAIASGDPKAIAQSWLICGPPGSGRSNVARAFAAALESPDHGLNDEPTKTTEQVLAGTHPDVSVLATNKVTIGIDEVRDIITTSEQMPGTAPWRIIVIEDVDRMMERTTNVLLKEIEEPSPHTIWPYRPTRRWRNSWNRKVSSRISRRVRHDCRRGTSASRACMPRTNAS